MPVEPRRVPIGAEAPDFSLESPGRGNVRLGDYRNRDQVILVFMRAFG
jgi:peroxiredoxin